MSRLQQLWLWHVQTYVNDSFITTIIYHPLFNL